MKIFAVILMGLVFFSSCKEKNELGYCLETFEDGHGACWLISKYECQDYAAEQKDGHTWVFTGPECEAKGNCQARDPETRCYHECLPGFYSFECEQRNEDMNWEFMGVHCYPEEPDC